MARGHRYKMAGGGYTREYSTRYEMTRHDTSRRTPKPVVGGSNPPAPATFWHEFGPWVIPGAFFYLVLFFRFALGILAKTFVANQLQITVPCLSPTAINGNVRSPKTNRITRSRRGRYSIRTL